ncbi:single-stranded-DNA-specific exonuclease RecJ [Metabacillus arenae]|uniref:Single-stranded-DNA-specific exonuclease RecJ n=1 Tax=Metabacillus arenae TaxID=2771434 RepID=A0A926NH77_9BACI|nr:single-stranded-DNA-specific exonuclease RecJ [Metabacillus arenae]MBD1381236.1 single-stranded-DNA-specific exonuclease RecJ [Metabacillus arenae]
MLKAKTRWSVKASDEENLRALVEQLNISSLVASLLVNRGIEDAETAKEFLHIDKPEFHNPFLLKGMVEAVERIQKAIDNHEKMMIFGDYDADGVSSTTVLLSVLKRLGADVDFYIPNRFTEGYGPNENAFRHIRSQDVTLIITVDTGIAAVKEAEVAKELNIDLIITDHHEPGPILPDAYAIIHPKQPGCSYPFKDLAGVGVAFKLAHAMLGKVPQDLLDVASIGTIADLVPLKGENRLIAKEGIKYLSDTNRVGLKALLKIAGVDSQLVNEETIGFALGPRINAVGRLQSADPAVKLLITDDEFEAKTLAEEIDLLNKERQKLVSKMTEEAVRQVEEQFPIENNPVLVIAAEGWNPGVVGIVASRLVERFYRPTIVLSMDQEKGIVKGSARSIAGFDLFESLSTCRDILPHFGGHPMAAGMTLKIEDINQLRERLIQLAKINLTEEDFTPITQVDAACELKEITLETITEMNKLAPFGMGNPKPVVMIQKIQLANMRKIGADQKHIKMTFQENGSQLDCVGFGFGFLHDEIAPISELSVIGELSINEWNNHRKPQLMLHDASIASWQLFDLRGVRDKEKVIGSIDRKSRVLITFQPDTRGVFSQFSEEIVCLSSNEQAREFDLTGKYAVLLDVPKDSTVLKELLVNKLPERIYVLFHQSEDHFFSTLPTRDHFKWYYAFLTKKGSFHLEKQGNELAKYRGWTKDTIIFMSQVFFELEFVKIENGIISINHDSKKRDLSESEAYAKKQKQFELEKLFIYSSYQQLKEWFDKQMQQSSVFLNV